MSNFDTKSCNAARNFRWLIYGLLMIVFSACSYLPEGELHPEGVSINETAEYIELLADGVEDTENGILFYPGGLVDPHAYIETLSGLATSNTRLIIVKVNANLAILESTKAEKIRSEFPSVQNWFTAGHSLGGLAAVATVKKHPDNYKGIILLAAYPNKANDISEWKGRVLSLYGTKDKVATIEDIEKNMEFLPPGENITELWLISYEMLTSNTTYYMLIEGANHSQFGAYGHQEGDGESDITAQEQKEYITYFVNTFITKSDWAD